MSFIRQSCFPNLMGLDFLVEEGCQNKEIIMGFFQELKRTSTFSAAIFIPGLLVVVIISIMAIVFPTWSKEIISTINQFGFKYFSWFYTLLVGFFVVFLILLALSNFGNIKLGDDEDLPDYPLGSWLAMLFAAGIGVGLMYYGVYEPMFHAHSIMGGDKPTENGVFFAAFHWGLHGWAIYGLMALGLAYFSYRYRLPLAVRSIFYPIFKDKIHGWAGNTIDSLALITTMFGLIITLSIGSNQVNAGLQSIGLVDEVNFKWRSIIIIIGVSIAVASAISGIGKGVRRISELNIIIAVILLLFILFNGHTVSLLYAFTDNVGYYLSHLFTYSFKTYIFEPDKQQWFQDWTIFYWVWWFSWAPFVGLFIAKISKGRTIREFVFGVLLVPTLFSLIWFTVFGNSGMWLDQQQNGALQSYLSSHEQMLFQFLNYFPFPSLISGLVIVLICLFFITSADSSIYVMNTIASKGLEVKIINWQIILWGMMLSILSVSLIGLGGLEAVVPITLVIALPFSIMMALMCFSLLKGLRVDYNYSQTKFNHSSVFWTGKNWKNRLKQIMIQQQEIDIESFMEDIALPAILKLKEEIQSKYDLNVLIIENKKPIYSIELIIQKQNIRNFVYGIQITESTVSPSLEENSVIENTLQKTIYQPMTYFNDGRGGYDVLYMSEEELIADILKQFQRYLLLLSDQEYRIIMHEHDIE